MFAFVLLELGWVGVGWGGVGRLSPSRGVGKGKESYEVGDMEECNHNHGGGDGDCDDGLIGMDLFIERKESAEEGRKRRRIKSQGPRKLVIAG